MKLAILIIAAATIGPFAGASIGLNASTIPSDCQALNGTYSVVTAGSQYQCSATNLTVVFDTNSQGVITHITWKGRRTPPLNVLLGSYSAEYERAFAAKAPSQGLQRNVQHETANVIVRRGGNARIHVGEIVLK